ncbi:MAG: hypothetical protein JWO85_116 [Candidatus Eremiobacteraeota bacterium]|nr:hypothetical protein [Candidatus Eremiobacteraeota bacterium]
MGNAGAGMETRSRVLASWRFNLRGQFGAVAVCLVLAALVWFAAVGTTNAARVDDLVRMIELGRPHSVLSFVERWWLGTSDAGWVSLAIAALQICCIVLCAGFAWALTRSVALGAAVGALALVSPFPEQWLGTPSGLADGVTVTALLVVFGTLLLGGDSRLRNAAAFAAVLVSGWPLAPLAAVAIVLRNSAGWWLVVAGVSALGVRAALGYPLWALGGHATLFGPYVVVALRGLVLCAAAIPAIIYAVRGPAARWIRRGTRAQRALLLAALVLVLTAGFLASAPAACFCAEAGILLVAMSVAAPRAGIASVRNACLVVSAVFVVVSVTVRMQPAAADNSPSVAQDRATLRAIAGAPAIVLVDHGDTLYRARYSKDVLAFLAGHALDVRYEKQPPSVVAGPVIEAGPSGLQRIDESLRAMLAFEGSRAHVVDDIAARSRDGRINDRTPQGTPSGLGVVPSMTLPGPHGAIGSIVVLSTFTYTFDRVRVRPGQRLVYLVAKALPTGTAAGATVTIDVPGRSPLTVQDEVAPAPPWGSLRWEYRSVVLPVAAPSFVNIRFAASSPSGRNIGDWVAYGAPAIVGE